MLAGSPPSAMATDIVSPRSAITRQCAAPTLWRCQCIARVLGPSTWTRYIPTLQALHAECQRHAPLRAEQIDRDRISRLHTIAQRGMSEQQRRPAARRLHAAVGDFRDFFVD